MVEMNTKNELKPKMLRKYYFSAKKFTEKAFIGKKKKLNIQRLLFYG